MKIEWRQCQTYEEAQDHFGILYLHEWNEKPFYWGKAHKSAFGGRKRLLNGLYVNPRYALGSRHGIEGCLRHGAKLYIGTLDEEALGCITSVEAFLIHRYGSVMNKPPSATVAPLDIDHAGTVPASIRHAKNSP